MIDALVIVLVLLPPLDWFVAIVLSYAARQHPDVLALRERAFAAVICAVVASIAGILAWVRLGVVILPDGSAIYLLLAGLVLASVPSLYWLFLLVTGRWRLEGGSE